MNDSVFDKFGNILNAVQQIWRTYKNQIINTHIDDADDMYHRDWDLAKMTYLASGEEALSLMLQGMLLGSNLSVSTILDMPCGFGRVIRHIHAAFPDAKVCACDLYSERIDFCAQTFNSIPFKSQENLQDIDFPWKFDLIWCGSLLTHLPAPLFDGAFELFSRILNDNGIAVVTTLGRISPYIQYNRFPYLPDESFKLVEQGFQSTGFGYADYNLQAQFDEQDAYGIAVVTPSYLMQTLQQDYSIRICGYIESGWEKQQDVVILKKMPVNSW